MAIHVTMYPKFGVNIPEGSVCVTNSKYEGEANGGSNVFHDSGQRLPIILVWIFHPGAKESDDRFQVCSVPLGQLQQLCCHMMERNGFLLTQILWIIFVIGEQVIPTSKIGNRRSLLSPRVSRLVDESTGVC